jgi:hypothetical protein
MRPRINNTFGRITRKELEKYLNDNQVYGHTVKRLDNTLIYSYDMMFRKTREQPETLFIEISYASKLVLKAWTNKGIKFNNIDNLKKYTKR